jgi:hypothetical protein
MSMWFEVSIFAFSTPAIGSGLSPSCVTEILRLDETNNYKPDESMGLAPKFEHSNKASPIGRLNVINSHAYILF